ncbi:MAG: pyrimidine dimer DNA glycosylase/endonuclease V [Nanoarchaeota archaeon]
MVRINIIEPWKLADQHLVAEYLEILMLLGHVKKHPLQESFLSTSRTKSSLSLKKQGIKSKIPENYVLGKGHINFFKNKLLYLKKRHDLIKKEMKKRGFATNVNINLKEFDKKYCGHWKSSKRDFKIIKKRLIWKIGKKPKYYRYYGEGKGKKFFEDLLKN